MWTWLCWGYRVKIFRVAAFYLYSPKETWETHLKWSSLLLSWVIWCSAFRRFIYLFWMFQLSCFQQDHIQANGIRKDALELLGSLTVLGKIERRSKVFRWLEKRELKDAKHTCTYFITFLKAHQHITHFFWNRKAYGSEHPSYWLCGLWQLS